MATKAQLEAENRILKAQLDAVKEQLDKWEFPIVNRSYHYIIGALRDQMEWAERDASK